MKSDHGLLMAGILGLVMCLQGCHPIPAPQSTSLQSPTDTSGIYDPQSLHVKGKTTGWMPHRTLRTIDQSVNHIMPVVTAHFGTRSVPVLLDTGSPISFVKSRQLNPPQITEKLQKKQTIQYPGNRKTLSFVVVSSMRFRNLEISDVRMGTTDFSHPRIDGIIGTDLLSSFNIHLDPAGGRSRLTTVLGDSAYQTTSFTFQEGRIGLPVSINGQGPFQLMLDTGSEMTVLSPATLKQLNEAPQEITSGNVRPRLKVGSIDLGSPRIRPPGDPFFLEDWDGLLGVNAFRDRRIQIDFSRQRLHVSESKATGSDH